MVSDNDAVTQLEATLDAVDGALARLRDGSYRSCEVCQAPIEESLLASDPLRTHCGQHLSAR